jgi:hypothetical protein
MPVLTPALRRFSHGGAVEAFFSHYSRHDSEIWRFRLNSIAEASTSLVKVVIISTLTSLP